MMSCVCSRACVLKRSVFALLLLACVQVCFWNRAELEVFDVVLLLVREARERGRERKPERGLVVRCSYRRATGDRVCCDL
jgi:hypothetical protein